MCRYLKTEYHIFMTIVHMLCEPIPMFRNLIRFPSFLEKNTRLRGEQVVSRPPAGHTGGSLRIRQPLSRRESGGAPDLGWVCSKFVPPYCLFCSLVALVTLC